jgi:branched-chain amino acid transport system substrate-binding protein
MSFTVSAWMVLIAIGCGSSPETITFGLIVPQSGDGAEYGKEVLLGAQLAAETINADGGVHRRKQVVLQAHDSHSDPRQAAGLFRQLAADPKVVAVIGGVTSGEALAMAPVAEETKTVLLSPTASTPALTQFGDYVWRNYPSDGQFVSVLAFYTRFKLRMKRAAVIAARNDYADGVRQVFARKFVQPGETEIKEFVFEEGALDPAAVIREVKAYRPDITLLVAYVDDQLRLIKEARAQRLAGELLASETFTVHGAELAGADADGVVTPQPPFDVNDANVRVRQFVAAFKNKYGHPPNVDSAHGYDAVRILASAISPYGDIKGTLKDNMRGVQDFQGVAGLTSFDVNGDVVKDPWLYRAEGGKLIRLPVE